MAYGRRGGSKSSFYAAGRPATQQSEPRKDWVPKIDKNSIYRTHDLFSSYFKRDGEKRLRLEAGDMNMTDCKSVITVRMKDNIEKAVAVELEAPDGETTRYRLECGHVWEGVKQQHIGKLVTCWPCSSHQCYLGLIHEWQHIWCKSNPVAWKLFSEGMAKEYQKLAPGISQDELTGFLMLLINCYDDIRCNSLEEYVFPGTAEDIWERWKRLTIEKGEEEINNNFIAYHFAVALGVPVSADSKFEPIRPIVEWAMKAVRKKGPGNMMTILRTTFDRCMGTLLADVPAPPPPQQGQPQQGGQNAQQQDSQQAAQPQAGGSSSDSSQDSQDQGQGTSGTDMSSGADDSGEEGNDQDQDQPGGRQDADGSDAGEPVGDGQRDSSQGLPQAPSAQAQAAQGGVDPNKAKSAMSSLMDGAGGIDPEEDHPPATDADVKDNPNSKSTAAMVAAALGQQLQDTDQLAQQLQLGQLDKDVGQNVQQLQAAIADKSKNSLLVDDAKAKVLLIDVLPADIDHKSKVDLDANERFAVSRMRTAFFKSMGQQKARRSEDGLEVDVESLIQHTIERKLGISPDSEIFKSETLQQGFAYHILSDMSGSMHTCFDQVAHSTEMLRQSLKFPFVSGRLWGFRGGGGGQFQSDMGEVWLYRYDKNCEGYIGKAKTPRGVVPVCCGGLTPMAAAIRVTVKHLITQVPAGMVKRLFLLTDGSPFATKVTAGAKGYANAIPGFLLQQFVRQEIAYARRKGVQVYALIIGDGISDEEARKMFDPGRFWKRVDVSPNSQNSVDRVLQKLVLDNFTKYLRARG